MIPALESSEEREVEEETYDNSSLLIVAPTDIQNTQTLEESMLQLEDTLKDRSTLSAFEVIITLMYSICCRHMASKNIVTGPLINL